MASHPVFQVEDQTDEDFFDNLVSDDDDIDFKGVGDSYVGSTEAVFVEGNESEEAKAFANLSIGEVGSDEKKADDFGNGDWGEEFGLVANGDVGGLGEGISEVSVSGNVEGIKGSFVTRDRGLEPTVDDNCGNNFSPASSDCTVICKSGEPTGSGIKEVGWSAFHTDSPHDDSNGFGTYSEFFTDLGENAGNAIGNVGGSVTPKASKSSQSAYTGVSNGSDHYQADYGYGATTDQGNAVEHTNSSQYYENLYPGWKFDPATGQWYQVDADDCSTSVQGNFTSNTASAWSFSDGNSEGLYLLKSAEPVAETMAESGRTETMSNLNQSSQFSGQASSISNQGQLSQETDNTGVASGWNQVSQVDSAYPSHMVFDPQYPGWYYDTIAQEWRSLDSYTASAQSTNQRQDRLNQNEFVRSNSYSHNDVRKTYADYNQVNQYASSQSFSSHGQDYNWGGGSLNNYSSPASGVWAPERVVKNETAPNYSSNHQFQNHYRQNVSQINSVSQQETEAYRGSHLNNGNVSQIQYDFPGLSRSQSVVSDEKFTQFSHPRQQNEQKVASNEYFGNQNFNSFPQQSFRSSQQYSYAPNPGRSSAGRPPHALVTFGFGGKLIIMKDTASLGNFSSASQNNSGYSVSILNMSEVITENADTHSLRPGTCDYFYALCRQSLPGPLAGANLGGKELNKWLDEQKSSLEFRDMDFRERNALGQLLSLLIIACQHYGKLRSPFGTDPMLKDNDLPGPAVSELFSSAKRNAAQYGVVAHCLQGLPSEAHLRATAAEVQSLLVSGKKTEALLCAQEGQLWGPALVLAAQLGNQFYVDTVKELALRQLVAGSPLRTLCLLIAGQPGDVFSADTATSSSMPGVISSPQQPIQLGANGMLDDWEENLAVIASNRTKDDELVLIHLGDCLWRERAHIFAAHICYLVAEANFEQYSDSARLCLVGADHLKFPRTYASPEAIQRTEIYEYSQVLGNSQYVLIPFQPYKLVYAHMLAEIGRLSDALKYCQAVQKSLKTGRSLEVETLRQVASSLEERIKTHQQGGFSTNLAPAKLVGKLLNNLFGGQPPPVPSKLHEQSNQTMVPRVSTSQSTMEMSSLVPSTSMEPMSEWTGDGSRRPMHNRSVSEPDFGRTPRQSQADSAKDASSASNQGKAASGFGRFGSKLLQKTVGLVLKPRQERQAKLGDSNKFYYDEKLKRWVEEGAELPSQEAALPPPPPTSSFQSGSGTNYNLNTAARDNGHLSNGSPEYKSHTPFDHNSGMPPLPPTSNQFSARGRMGVRSRYVDTFNQGGGNPTNLFSSPSVPSVRPAAGANPKFFVPAPVSSSESRPDNVVGFSDTDENPSVSTVHESFQSGAFISSVPIQRYPSMDNISSKLPTNGDAPFSLHSRRTVSWNGSLNDSQDYTKKPELKPLGEVLGMPPSSFMPNGSRLIHSSGSSGNSRDELHEVEL